MPRLARAHPRLDTVGVTRLTQTYTLTPAGTGTADTSYEADNAVSGAATYKPCLYDPRPQIAVGNDGSIEVNQPVLYVAPDDPIKAGDLVSNIKSGETIVLAGPAKVELVVAVSMMDVVLAKAARLRASDIH